MRHVLQVPEISAKPTEFVSARPAPTRLWTRVGIALLALSFALWLPIPVVPFLPIDIEVKAGLGAGFFLVAEISFWLGTALAGPEALKRMRSWIRLRRAS